MNPFSDQNSSSRSEITLKVEKHQLENGLILLFSEDRSVPTVSFMTYINAGARDEVKPGTTGLAHVFEHMMFRGTTRYPDYDKVLIPYGPETNASTGHDYTRYFVNLKSEFLEKIIEIEADRFRNLNFTNEVFRTELGPVKEERRKGYVDNPDGFIYTKLYEMAYRVHPYHHPVIGWEEDLEKNMQYTDGLEFFRTYYSPNNCCICIVGNFDKGEALECVRRYYGGWKRQEPPDLTIPAEPPQTEERESSFTWKDSHITPRIAIAYHGPSLDLKNPDFAALLLISRILFMQSQRITKKLYTDLQLVESIFGEPDDSKDPGLFFIYANLKKGKSLEEVKKIIFEEIDDLLARGIEDRELQKAKNSIMASILYSLNRPFSIANILAFYETVAGDHRVFFELGKKVAAITKQNIKDAARKVFRKENRITVMLHPKL